MALKKYDTPSHFWLRLSGITGVFVVLAGLVLWLGIGRAEGAYLALGGGLLILLAVAREIPLLKQNLTSRRGAAGSSVVLQILLAVVLLAGVNVFSFLNYLRFDLTWDSHFTLDSKFRGQLANLRQETTIVIYQRHTAFGQSPENPPDTYDAAAQRQIVERVKDLAEMFQDLGPRFRVEVLDSHDDDFEGRLQRLKKDTPRLAAAIEKSRENSIFFYARPADSAESPAGDLGKDRGHVQVLSYGDIFQLDRKASLGEEGGTRNLVLRDQGVGAFVSKILNIQEKRPRVGFAVTHEYLGADGHPFFGMRGAKKVLEARGFDCVDLVLKDLRNRPVVLTHDEHSYERIEGEIVKLEGTIKGLKETVELYSQMRDDFVVLTKEGNAEVNKKYFYLDLRTVEERPGGRPGEFFLVPSWEEDLYSGPELERELRRSGWVEGRDFKRKPGKKITPEAQETYLEEDLLPLLKSRSNQLKANQEELEEKRKELASLNAEGLTEQKRISDMRAKLDLLLANCDVLIVPRLTFWEPDRGGLLDYQFHTLEPGQVEAIKEFMKAGKPVLFAFGPGFNEKGEQGFEADKVGDGLDDILLDLGVRMPPQAILHDKVVKSWVSRTEGRVLGLKTVEPPPLQVERVVHSTPTEKDRKKQRLLAKEKAAPSGPLSPIRDSLSVVAKGISMDSPKDLVFRYPRPVYWMPEGVPEESAVILSTHEKSWNEDYPFPKLRPSIEGLQMDVPKPPDEVRKVPNKGTWLEMRRGPFPVGIALQTRLPFSWFLGESRRPPETRVVVLGEGAAFKGEDLSPMKERLLLDVTNWLLGRDNLLARESQAPRSFLRVALDDQTKTLWGWSMWLGLPLLFVYLGSVVMLKRRMR